MAKISTEEIAKLAKLARVGLTEEEKITLSNQMGEILEYVKQLDEVSLADVEPTSQVTGLKNVYVDDQKRECLIARDELLANAPERENGYIKVKQVLEDKGYSL